MSKKWLVSTIDSLVRERDEIRKRVFDINEALDDSCWHPKKYIHTGDWWQTNSDWDQFAWYQRDTKCLACNKRLVEEVKSDSGRNYERKEL